jgi:hypothetical protein
VQAKFVDTPSASFGLANGLVVDVMRERGYPIEDFDQRAADLSVDHPELVEHYRAAREVFVANDEGRADTEDLRTAMVHLRSLMAELLDDGASGAAHERPLHEAPVAHVDEPLADDARYEGGRRTVMPDGATGRDDVSDEIDDRELGHADRMEDDGSPNVVVEEAGPDGIVRRRRPVTAVDETRGDGFRGPR